MAEWTRQVHSFSFTVKACIQAHITPKTYVIPLIFSLLFLVINSAYTAPAAKIYYVAPHGSDSNPGTIEAPWQHISYAASNTIVKPGDTVYIRSGTYGEYIKQEISGSPGNPITYQNYPGETPIITDNGSGRSWRWQILDQSYVRLKGLTFKDYVSGAIQVRTINKDIYGVEIIDCTFENQHSTDGENHKTIHVTPYTSGHTLYEIVIQGNRFVNMDTADAQVVQFDGRVINSKIIENTLKNSTNIGIGISGRPEKGQPENLLIQGNDVSGHGSPGKTTAGIYINGAGANIIIENNVVHDGYQGIKIDLEPEAATLITSHVIVRHNVLYNTSQQNLKMGAGESCNRSGTIRDSVVIHNTIFTAINNIANVTYDCGENLRWKNNIYVHTAPVGGFQYRLLNLDVDASTWVLDYNLFLNNSGELDHYKWFDHRYDTLTTFQAISNQDRHSIQGDPAFVDSNSFNFELREDSPARDAGGPLTRTTSSGSGTVVLVQEAWYFTNGFGLQGGDRIRVGNNPPVEVVQVNYNLHQITLNSAISWNAGDPVSYDYYGSGPDIGAFEFSPALSLTGIPGDGFVDLRWIDNGLPDDITWHLRYEGPEGNEPSSITNIAREVDTYKLTGLTNYTIYQITLSAVQDNQPIMTDTLQIMPTDLFVYLPVVQK